MDKNTVIGIELDTLRILIADVVRAELQQAVTPPPPSLIVKDKLYTKDVALYLSVTRQTVTRYRKDGLLPEPFLSPGGKPYWLLSQIDEFIKKNLLGYKFKP